MDCRVTICVNWKLSTLHWNCWVAICD